MTRWAALAGVSLLAAAAARAQAGRRIPTIAEVEAIAAFLLDPLVNLRVAGRALPETEGMFSFPDLGDATNAVRRYRAHELRPADQRRQAASRDLGDTRRSAQ